MKTITTEVLNNSSQSKLLVAGFSKIQASKSGIFYQFLIGENSPQNYQLNELQVYEIIRDREITVVEEIKGNPGCGYFSLGNAIIKSVYNHKLFPNPLDLEAELYRLLNFSLTGQEVYDSEAVLAEPVLS